MAGSPSGGAADLPASLGATPGVGVRHPGPSCWSDASVGTPDRRPYHLRGAELAWGWVPGWSSEHSNVDIEPSSMGTPLEAVEGVLRPLLGSGPVMVTFSGGRDSSALLATACALARREGLDNPVAVTLRYPGVPAADESTWQEIVVRHIGVADWLRLDLEPDQAELFGAVPISSLRRHGLLWPPLLHQLASWLPAVSGAAVVTGEGGDEVLGPRRLTLLRRALREYRHHPTHVRAQDLRSVFAPLAPSRLREAAAQRQQAAVPTDWLQPDMALELARRVAADEAAEPLSWRRALFQHPHRRCLVHGEANRDLLGAEHGVRFVHPFLEPAVISALARHGGPMGYAGRTDAMRKIFGSLLPDEVSARTSKARFNQAVIGPLSRAFLASWDGEGVDRSAVDVDGLRAAWAAEVVPAGTMALAQAVWLHRQGLAAEGEHWSTG